MRRDKQATLSPDAGSVRRGANSATSPKTARLRLQILIPLALLIIGLVIICCHMLSADAESRIDEESIEAVNRVPVAFQAALAEEAAKMDSTLEVLAQDSEVRKAFLNGSSSALLKKVEPLFRQLREKHKITHFYFHGSDRVCILRMHKPDRYGDKINRFTALEAEKTGKTSWGIELGPLGTFTLRVVRPWYEGDRLIGYLELGEEIEHVIEQLHESLGMDLIVTIRKQFIDRQEWQEGMKMLGRDPDWDLSPVSVVIDQTLDSIPAVVSEYLCEEDDDCRLADTPIQIAGRKYRVYAEEFDDAGGRAVGELVILRDVTLESATLKATLLRIQLAFATAGAMIIGFFYLFLGKIQSKLASQSSALESEISERKQAEEKLGVEKNRLQDILDGMIDGVTILDMAGKIATINHATTEQLGYTEQEVIGKTPEEIFLAEQELGKYHQSIETLASDQVIRDQEYLCIHKDGTTFPMALNLSVLKDIKGNPTAVIAVHRDVTERRRAEQALRDSEVRHKTLYESSSDAIMILAPPTWKFTAGNPETIKLFGAKNEEDFITQGPWCVSPEYQPDGQLSSKKAKEMIETAVRTGSHFFEWEHMTLDGRPFSATVLLTRIELENRQLLQATVRNISEHKKAEELLRQAQQAAQHANQAKSDFLANMSHEIRTPMTAILGYTDLLTDSDLSPSDRHNHLAVIRRSGEHLLALINDILDLSKVEAGKMTTEILPCSVVSIVADTASIMRVRAEQHNILLAVEYKSQMPETILSDGARFRQALVNLLGNAIKFTEDGSVRIVPTFLPNWQDGIPAVRIQVIDTGIGISPEQLLNLFDPFVQADPSTSRKFGGTGLGLTITKHIAELLGGELTVQSTLGKGSTFTLIIPTGSLEAVQMLASPAEAVQEQRAQDPDAIAGGDLEGLRILLAEDGIDNQNLIRYLLGKTGAEVEVADNGRIAVEKAAAEHFDLILMDMQMPEMDGYEATGLLRKRGFTRPIVALTAHAMSEDRQQCLKAGCDDYLAKPVNPAKLIQTIARHCDKEFSPQGVSSDSSQKPSSEGPAAISSEFAADPDFVEIIDQFVSGLPERIESMQEALANGDLETLGRLAHQLKGSGGSYGYSALSDPAKALEDTAKARDHEASGLALAPLTDLCRAIIAGHNAETISQKG